MSRGLGFCVSVARRILYGGELETNNQLPNERLLACKPLRMLPLLCVWPLCNAVYMG